jgi:putative membrane-bound dehydrogenase-like protein
MHPPHCWFLLALILAFPSPAAFAAEAPFRAGAAVVDIAPDAFPVRVNAMFTERSADAVVDSLLAKALALDDGTNRLVFCVVDTCMMPRDLIDRAKADASRATGLPVERMLVAATHTHSAPSAMGCLGSRVDPRYAAYLPGRITQAIVAALERLAPARIGWAQVDDWEHTFNRRWIRRLDKVFADPFGQPTVRANMHPGYESPDAIGPSGPVDPQLSVLALQTLDGRPLALLANYSMHYYGSPLLSSDYYGRFATYVAGLLGAGDDFVAIMSQGTSGDLMWMDYGAPRNEIGYDAYAREIAEHVSGLVKQLAWRDSAPLKIAERKLELGFRVPDANRLAWARDLAAKLGDRLPQSQPEIYALEAIYLHERPRAELILQALRIGDLGITALPNEVYALTGLKLKRQSPFAATFNIELANGAEGYIPPPEQHALGGYTTWAARTAGLEVQAEPRIVETTLALLEEVAGRTRRPLVDGPGPYAKAVLDSQPAAYWRLEEMVMPAARDTTGRHNGRFENGVALFLPGADGRIGHQPPEPPATNAFSGTQINRAVHFAGGRLRADVPLGENYSVEFWLWNGLPSDARAVTGYAYSRGADGDPAARGEHLGIGGTHRSDLAGRLFLFNGNERNEIFGGRTTLALRAWHHVVFVREGRQVRVHLDGRAEPEIAGEFAHTIPAGNNSLFIGGRNDGLFGFEGKLDEVALYPRALSAVEIGAHYHASGLTPPTKVTAIAPLEPPLSPQESLKIIHVRAGFEVELVASEPLTIDPVAIDWDAAGRLWVVEMADYPLGMDGKGQPGGRVRVLEDTDGDGRYDRQTLFAEGLNFPTGLLTWRDGVIVTAAPEILLLRDTDGDGRADSREVLVSGLTTGNQQLRANGLRWGLDGWVYCAAGGHYRGYAAETRLRTRAGEVAVGSRDFRFRPDTGELEAESGPSQFGRERDDWGRWFGTQNIRPLWHYVLADEYLRRNPHVAAPDPTKQVVTPLPPKVFPASSPEKRFHSFNEAGHFTSACSGMIYRDELLFPRAAGEQHAFTCEPFHNLVQHNIVTDEGVSFTARRDAPEGTLDFFASEDRWSRPVMARTGPDGALWVVDMYRYMIEHPEWLPAAGRDELLPNYRLGADRGRIYRVFPSGKRPRTWARRDQLTTPELVAALASPNGWQRDQVHMLLTWRADAGAVAPLQRLAATSPNPLARVHALWVLEQLKGLTPELIVAALRDQHPGVRENALRLAETLNEAEVIAAAAKLVADSDTKVRLQLAFTLGTWNSAVAGQALGSLAVAHMADGFMRAAVFSSAVPHLQTLTKAALTADRSAQSALTEPLADLALASGDRASLADLLQPAFTPSAGAFSPAQLDAAARLADTATRRKTSLAELARGGDPAAEILTAALGDSPKSIFTFARRTVANEHAALDLRAASARLIARDPARRADTLELLRRLLTPRQPVDLQQAALAGLAATGDPAVPGIVLTNWLEYSPATRTVALEVLQSREPWAFALLEQLAGGAALPLDATQRARLLQHSSRRVRDLAGRTFAATATSRAQVIEQYQPALRLVGDAVRGRAIYDRVCLSCHKLGDAGGEVGPDLRSVAGHPPEKLLANILDPSADVQPGYHAYQFELADGTELYGLITAETGNSLTLKSADGTTHTILRRELKELRGANISLMPDGLESGLSPQDLADLIQLLRSPGPP